MSCKRFCSGLFLSFFLFFSAFGPLLIAQTAGATEEASRKKWATTLELLSHPKPSPATRMALLPLVEELVDTGVSDPDGLSIAMHAAALGNLEILTHIASRSREALFQKHPKTGLNLLHFAAQARGSGGSAILKWMFAAYPEEALEMTNARAFNPQGKGNGHTVAMEAAFTKRAETIQTLLELASAGRKIDFTTPAVTGWGPRTIAEREKLAFAPSLPASQVPADQRVAWVAEQDRIYLSSISSPQERAVEEAGIAFLKLISEGKINEALGMVKAAEVSINGLYGRLQGTALSTVSSPSANRTPEQISAQVEALLGAGADPRVAEGSLMFVHGGFRSAVFGFSDAMRRIIEHVETTYGKSEAIRFVNSRGPENGVTMGLDASWRRRADVLSLWLDKGGDPRIPSFAGETILQALEDWIAESRITPSITPPPPALVARVKGF